MRPVVAVLGGAWGLLNLAVAILFVANAFVAKTAIKEGLPAQAALLFGGILIGLFAVLVLWECYRLITKATAEAS